MVREERIHYLIQQYAAETATEEEVNELSALLLSPDEDKTVENALKSYSFSADLMGYDRNVVDKMIDNILLTKKASVVPMKRSFGWMRWAAAAVVMLMLGSLAFWYFNSKDQKDQITAVPEIKKDILPGGDKAILTLANGRQIVLDSASDGSLTTEGGVKVIKIGGQLSYDMEGKTAAVLYNTISTPRGGQYQLELADGSKVWLNSASSLRFPMAFSGDDRTVELTGEGYFEIAHNPAMPFHVMVGEMDVQVVGTQFNINSYSDEPSIKTTLLEGKVWVRKNNSQVYLNPGQQAILSPGADGMRVSYDVNVEEVVAWKNGKFLFNSADIESIMRQVARWYDVEVEYQGKVNETVSGGLSRSENASQLLKILELAGKLDFEIDGHKIVVKPKE